MQYKINRLQSFSLLGFALCFNLICIIGCEKVSKTQQLSMNSQSKASTKSKIKSDPSTKRKAKSKQDAKLGNSKKVDSENQEKESPTRFELSVFKRFTFVEGPIRENGLIDYATAINRVQSKDVTNENNIVAALPDVFGAEMIPNQYRAAWFKEMGLEEPGVDGSYFVDWRDFLKANNEFANDIEKLGVIKQLLQKPWTSEQFPLVAKWINAQSAQLQKLESASKRKKYYAPFLQSQYPINSAVQSIISKISTARFTFFARAMLNAGENRIDEAINDLMSCQRFGRLLQQGTSLVEAAGGYGYIFSSCREFIRLQQKSKLSPQHVEKIRTHLNSFAPFIEQKRRINFYERMMFLDNVQQFMQENFEPIADKETRLTGILLVRYGVDYSKIMRNGNQYFDRVVKILEKKETQTRLVRWEKLDAELNAKTASDDELGGIRSNHSSRAKELSDILIKQHWSLLSVALPVELQSRDMFELTRIVFAISAFKQKRGKIPDDLSQLQPEFLTKIPIDSFSGKPFNFTKTKSGYTVFGIGPERRAKGDRNLKFRVSN